MKVDEIVYDQHMVFQCTKCFNRFVGVDRLLVDSNNTVICPIDKQPVKQLHKGRGKEGRIEMGDG